MELADGGTIRPQLRPGAPSRPFADRLADARAIIEGVAALHAADIVHRDIKPENILRMADGRLVVTDFGLSLDPGNGPTTVIVGTPAYMAPEVVMGDVVSMRSDVWSLGVVLHEVLFEKRPEWDVVGGRRRLRTPEMAGRKLSRAERRLTELCGRCVAETPDERPANANAVLGTLQIVLRGRSLGFSARNRRRLRAIGWATVASAALIVLSVFGGRLWNSASASAIRREISLTPASRKADDAPLARSRVVATFDDAVSCMSFLARDQKLRVVQGQGLVEDVELSSGRRQTWRTAAEVTVSGCPQWSSDGRRLLYEKPDPSGAMQVWSADEHGQNGSRLVAGSAPIWVGRDEFAFNIDASHVAIFSTATMETRLLPDPASDLKKDVARKSIGVNGQQLLVKYLAVNGSWLVARYALPNLRILASVNLPMSTDAVGTGSDDSLLVVNSVATGSDLVRVAGTQYDEVRLLGQMDREIADLTMVGTNLLALSTRKVTTEIEVSRDGESERRVQIAGWIMNPALGPGGRVLANAIREGRYIVVSLDAASGEVIPITSGPTDMRPVFTADGSGFIYTDLQQQSLVRCSLDGSRCRRVRNDLGEPASAVEGPQGDRFALLTFQGVSRVWVQSGSSAPGDLGPARVECTPIWEDAKSLWVLRGSNDQVRWTLIDVLTGDTKGERPAQKLASPSPDCPTAIRNGAPSIRAVRTEKSDLRTVSL
jgi:serine/threonine protein kinase